jgi:putative DNA primase/helicase
MADDGDVFDLELLKAEVARLAKLSLGAYELERRKVAERLKIRAAKLDMLVARARGDSGTSEDLPGQAVAFPEDVPWPEEVELSDILDALCEALEKLMIMTDDQRLVFSLWVVFTHCLDSFDHSPRLEIKSAVMRSGKTKLVRVARHVVAKALLAVSISAAALFRVIEEVQPTVLMDEADTYITADARDIRGIINGGFDKSDAVAVRVEGQEQRKTRAYSIWCAMCIARIGNSAATIEDRCVSIVLERKLPGEKVERLGKAWIAKLQEIRRQLVRWTRDHADEVRGVDPAIPDKLNDRAADGWRPILALAEMAGQTVAEQARNAALSLSAENETETQPAEIQALADIYGWLTLKENETKEQVSSGTLATYLAGLEGGRWVEYGRKQEPITKHQLTRLLKRIKVISTSIWEGTPPRSAKGYSRDALLRAANRYLSPSQLGNPPNA